MIAHVGGVPLEESLLQLVSGAGAGLMLARAWAERWISNPRRIPTHKRQLRPPN